MAQVLRHGFIYAGSHAVIELPRVLVHFTCYLFTDYFVHVLSMKK